MSGQNSLTQKLFVFEALLIDYIVIVKLSGLILQWTFVKSCFIIENFNCPYNLPSCVFFG